MTSMTNTSTESDRDSLARIIFTATDRARLNQKMWERASLGMRNWCKAKADEAMADGWQKVGADQVVVSRDEFENLLKLHYVHFGNAALADSEAAS